MPAYLSRYKHAQFCYQFSFVVKLYWMHPLKNHLRLSLSFWYQPFLLRILIPIVFVCISLTICLYGYETLDGGGVWSSQSLTFLANLPAPNAHFPIFRMLESYYEFQAFNNIDFQLVTIYQGKGGRTNLHRGPSMIKKTSPNVISAYSIGTSVFF